MCSACCIREGSIPPQEYSSPFEPLDATNHFGDEFSILHASLPLAQYEQLRHQREQPEVRAAFSQITDAFGELGYHVRFIAADLQLERDPAAHSGTPSPPKPKSEVGSSGDKTEPPTSRFRFDFGISFAGPDRGLARQLRDGLRKAGFEVFFDEDYEHEMIGHDGSVYLRNVYSRECRFCLVLISRAYDKRDWTNLEREAVQARELRGERGILIPVPIEDYQPTWLPETRIRFDLWKRSIPELVTLLTKRVRYDEVARRAAPDLVALQHSPICASDDDDGGSIAAARMHDPAAMDLLRAAAQSPSRRLLLGDDNAGRVIMVCGGAVIADSLDPRKLARYEAALAHLVRSGLLRSTDKGIFEVTHEGYNVTERTSMD